MAEALSNRESTHVSKLGFVGLGTMGRPMAANLIKAGHPVYLQSRSGVPTEPSKSPGRSPG